MKKILFVDDEPNVLAAFQRQLRKQFDVQIAVGSLAGLDVLEDWHDYAVVVADMRMPDMNGVEFLSKVKGFAPDVVRMMLTGNADQGTAIDAINEGNIFRFLNKPCPSEDLIEALNAGIRQHHLITAERELLENTLRASIKVLTEILAMAEPKSFGHAEALRRDMRLLADSMELPDPWQFEVAAMLAPIGVITLPPEVALKARIGHALSAKEQDMCARVPAIGGSLIAQIPRLEEVSKIIIYQNKRFDGVGLPDDQISGAAIPLGARMLKVLRDLAEIEAKGVKRADALDQMRNRLGWYDPQVLDAVGACFQLSGFEAADVTKPAEAVTVAGLLVGHLLRAPVETKDGVLVVAAGTKITPALLERLRNFSTFTGIQEPIYVEDSWETRRIFKDPAKRDAV